MKLVLPGSSEGTIQDIIFSILSKEYPLKLIELHNLIKKRYARGVTYQAVRKAVMELVEDGMLEKLDFKYQIRKEWVQQAKTRIDALHKTLSEKKAKPETIDSIKGEVSVFQFGSYNELMQFWEEIIDDWYNNFKTGDPSINCFQGAHAWEGLLHPDTEQRIMGQLKKKGIESYVLTMSNTPLDKYLIRFYKKMGLKTGSDPSTKQFDKKFYVGTYGETIVQTILPDDLMHEMEEFFHKNTSIENMDLQQLSHIMNKKRKVALTVIKNLQMAEHINKGILNTLEPID